MKSITPIEEAVALKAIKDFRLKNILDEEGYEDEEPLVEDEEPLVEDEEANAELEKLEESVEAIDEELEKDAEIEAILI